jgi:hypothetical protein
MFPSNVKNKQFAAGDTCLSGDVVNELVKTIYRTTNAIDKLS